MKELLTEQEEEDRKEDDDSTPPDNRSHREKQIEKLKKQADRIEAWLKENGERLGVKGKEIKSNITDNESSKMVTSNGTIQGYNGQALVDSKTQVIVHAEVIRDRPGSGPCSSDDGWGQGEHGEDGLDSEDYFKGTMFTADSGYHSKVNIQKCMDEEMDAYIPDKRFRTRDPGYEGRRKQGTIDKDTLMGVRTSIYDEEKDQYDVPQWEDS